MVFKKVKPLQHIGLFDVGRTQNAIPRPLLIDGALAKI